jgi:hypothetical protein
MMGRPAQDFLHDESLRGILIAKLLSPAARHSITPTWWSQCFPPALMASEARLGASLGFRVHKVKERDREDPIAQAAAICAAIPNAMKVWLDANATWGTVDRSIAITKELAKFPNYFAIESPIPRADIDGYRKMRGKLTLPVAEHVDGLALDLWTREKLIQSWIVAAPKLGRYVAELSQKSVAARAPIWIEHSGSNIPSITASPRSSSLTSAPPTRV